MEAYTDIFNREFTSNLNTVDIIGYLVLKSQADEIWDLYSSKSNQISDWNIDYI